MPATKHAFPCGHRGYGQFCHRCFQAKGFEEEAAKIGPDEALLREESKYMDGRDTTLGTEKIIRWRKLKSEATRLRERTVNR
jgi:hypothetical protein